MLNENYFFLGAIVGFGFIGWSFRSMKTVISINSKRTTINLIVRQMGTDEALVFIDRLEEAKNSSFFK